MYVRFGALGLSLTLSANLQRDTDENSGLYAGLDGGIYERYVEPEVEYEYEEDRGLGFRG